MDTQSFDAAALQLWAGFVWRSLGRNKLKGLLAGLMVFGMAAFLLWVFPKKYQAESKLLASRNTMMSSLGNRNQTNESDRDGPTRAAQETVMARENLVAIVRQTRLIEDWQTHRHPVMRLKDKLIQALHGEPTDEQRLDGMVGALEKRLNVYVTEGTGTVVIGVSWPDAEMARLLVETAQQNFLEARRGAELSAISDTLAVLEQHASEAETAIDEGLSHVNKVASDRRAQARADAQAARAASKETPGSSALTGQIRAKHRAIAELEEARTRRLAELQVELAQQKLAYADKHPLVVDSQQRIDALRARSPQLEALKRDELALMEASRSGGGSNLKVAPAQTTFALERDDPAVSVAQSQLAMATSRHQDILLAIGSARVELDTARAAFKYRYTVVTHARTPREPISPNATLVLIAAFLASVLFAFLTTTLIDLRKGRAVETSRVNRWLGVPVVGRVKQ